MKVKMLCRHTGPNNRKLEKGHIYKLPPGYAMELISHGIAVLVVEIPEPPPGLVVFGPPPRDKSGRFRPRGKK